MKDDLVYVLHIRDSIIRIKDYTSTGQASFMSESIRQDATIRNLEIIGEAVKQLSMDTREAHPEIPWKQIAGMRDKMVHEYFGVNLRLVWDVVERALPQLLATVDSIIKKSENQT